jgi:hypothetical protein
MDLFTGAIVCAILSVAVVTDLWAQKIPNLLTLPAILAGAHGVGHGVSDVVEGLADLLAQSGHGGDDEGRDQGGDQAVLQGGDAVLVLEQVHQSGHHDRSPLVWWCGFRSRSARMAREPMPFLSNSRAKARPGCGSMIIKPMISS